MRINFLFFWIPFFCFSQQTILKDSNYTEIDSLYREDQFYASISYNLIQNRPEDFKQFSFSPGITLGFLRDFPISKNRKWSVAPGFGYSYNNIKQFLNLYEITDEGEISGVSKEVFSTVIISHGVEFPFEIRWRNSNAKSHSFWRIYSGFKATYVFNSKIKLEYFSEKSTESLADVINKWQYGVYISAGFNTWNPYVYYGLNPIFNDGTKMSNFNIGFMFYIL